mgnify:CR=1 FL=1
MAFYSKKYVEFSTNTGFFCKNQKQKEITLDDRA